MRQEGLRLPHHRLLDLVLLPTDGQQRTPGRRTREHPYASPNSSNDVIARADGNRLLRKAPGATTLYLGSQELLLVSGSAVARGTRQYVLGGQTIAVRTAAGVSWQFGDHQGTQQVSIAVATLAVTQRRQTPFGEPRGAAPASWPDEKGFVGGTLDSSGLTRICRREYDPAVGRFISVDPVMDTADPQQWNGYAYANNSPVTFSDPNRPTAIELCGR